MNVADILPPLLIGLRYFLIGLGWVLVLTSLWYGCIFKIGHDHSPHFYLHINGIKPNLDLFRDEHRAQQKRVQAIRAAQAAEAAEGCDHESEKTPAPKDQDPQLGC